MADTYAQVAREFIAVKMDTEQPNIFEEALLPSRPSSPNKSKNVLLGFVIGLVLSCGIIVVQFLMDDRLRSADDIEKYVQLPTLGVMPKQEEGSRSCTAARAAAREGRREAAMRQAKIKRFNALDYTGTEAINTICTNLSFSGRDCKRIAFH
ncbi:MAG: YveK family protein [Christensenellales bacterium]